MKKIVSILALVAILFTSNMHAENEGFFMGGSLLISGIQKIKEKKTNHTDRDEKTDDKRILNFLSFVLGYTHNLGDSFSLRYYGLADANGFRAFNYNLMVDVLYTLAQSDSAEFRVFAGGWLGVVEFEQPLIEEEYSSSFDLGINAGVRAVFSQKHGIDFYGRFGFLTQSKEYDRTIMYSVKTWKVSQPYLIGIRYTYTF